MVSLPDIQPSVWAIQWRTAFTSTVPEVEWVVRRNENTSLINFVELG
ncbi:hypothetical protein SCNRRL3882_7784 [Streptomyces chartreusis NRRL 3882]|uniref:Uncharacterized protein n=1 Tax=Streptomyces chartreusis NRRL 3882 TaxID=1079985 RepID=A0A2N9BLU6_STRCX|nr:hypothetical protein SCNRRL3882_7784 [Streptomyces chartreusis NRRL 3882]